MDVKSSHSAISKILDKAEAEIAIAELDIQQWKQCKLSRTNDVSSTTQDPVIDAAHRSQRSSFSNKLTEPRPIFIPDSISIIEKRIKDLELSREVESSENLKKISKLEKALGQILHEKSVSPARFDRKSLKNPKNNSKIRSASNKHPAGRSKSPLIQKPKRTWQDVKELENEAEKWKKKAKTLERKVRGQLRGIKREVMGMKVEMRKETEKIRSYCLELCKKPRVCD